LDDVEPFLRNIFPDRPLTPLFIDRVRQRYRRIGGKSPLLEITRRQARFLEISLRRAGRAMEVSIGMKNWQPTIQNTVKTMADKGTKKIICLFMSPFSTRATAQSYKCSVLQAVNNLPEKMETHFVPSWHTHSLYIDALCEKVKEGLSLFPSGRRPFVEIIFSAHSLPLSTVKDDPYVDQIKATISVLMQRLKNSKWHLAFQSRGQKGEKWLSPDTEDLLKTLARQGTKEVLSVPIGFVSDHLETLYDLDIFLKKKADDLGLQYQRTPSLNESPKFIEALTHFILLPLEQTDRELS